MLDAAAAVAAAGSPAQPRALIFTAPAIVLPNTTITVDGSTSVGGAGTGINQYLWTLPDSGGIASLGVTTNASTATITTTGEGTFTVRLRVTDANNAMDTRDMVVSVATPPVQQPGNPSNGSGGGGGALSWPWLLALLGAWTALATQPPVRGCSVTRTVPILRSR
jgi:serine protease